MKGQGSTRGVDKTHVYSSMSASEYNVQSESSKINEEERRSIYDEEFGYINSIGYDYIEAYLNGDELIGTMKDKFEDHKTQYLSAIKSLDNVTEKNRLQKNQEFFRFNDTRSIGYNWGINVSGKSDSQIVSEMKAKIGKTYQEKSFLSTSAVEGKNKMSFRPVKVKIQAPKGTKAYVTTNKDESEVLLGRGLKYKLMDAKMNNGKIELTYRIVKR